MHTIPDKLRSTLEKFAIDKQAGDWSLDYVFLLWQQGKLDLQPSYQRGGDIWSRPKKVKWIESLLAGFPTMAFFIAQTPQGWEMIDGQQRTRTYIEFRLGEFFSGGKFVLSSPEYFHDLKGLAYQDFTMELRNRIDEYSIRVIKLGSTVSDDLKHKLFVRLNEDPSTLTRQELRNGSFVGPLSLALRDEFQHHKLFRRIIGRSSVIKWHRMAGAEWVLRFLAFHTLGTESYRGQAEYHDFLDNIMRDFRHTDTQQLQEFREVWDRSLTLVDNLWGTHGFRRFAVNFNIQKLLEFPNKIQHGKWVPKPTLAMFDTMMLGLSPFQSESVMDKKDIIKEELLYLMVSDHKFRDSLKGGTGSSQHIRIRVNTFREAIRDILDARTSKDSFTLSRKQEIFEQESTCPICGKRILRLEDAVAMSYGDWKHYGRVLPRDSQFSHRFCLVMEQSMDTLLPQNIIAFRDRKVS